MTTTISSASSVASPATGTEKIRVASSLKAVFESASAAVMVTVPPLPGACRRPRAAPCPGSFSCRQRRRRGPPASRRRCKVTPPVAAGIWNSVMAGPTGQLDSHGGSR